MKILSAALACVTTLIAGCSSFDTRTATDAPFEKPATAVAYNVHFGKHILEETTSTLSTNVISRNEKAESGNIWILSAVPLTFRNLDKMARWNLYKEVHSRIPASRLQFQRIRFDSETWTSAGCILEQVTVTADVALLDN